MLRSGQNAPCSFRDERVLGLHLAPCMPSIMASCSAEMRQSPRYNEAHFHPFEGIRRDLEARRSWHEGEGTVRFDLRCRPSLCWLVGSNDHVVGHHLERHQINKRKNILLGAEEVSIPSQDLQRQGLRGSLPVWGL